MVSVDITAFTTAGYVGKNVEEIIEKLLINANLDVKKCESGIVYIDEIDKIVAKGNPKMDSDVGGASLQHSLLKIIEGDKINITIRCQTGLHNFEVDTSKILFICGGSFAKVVESKIQSKKTIGFDKLQENIDDVEDVTGEDIVASGFSREIMGRLPVIVQMHDLTLDEIVRIIKEPKNSILQQCKNIFAFDGIDLSISDEACRLIAEKCLEKKFGARGLKTIFESVMFKYMYEAQSLSEKYNRLDFTVKDGDVVGNWSKLKEKTVKK
jgi:ATP-dependent Clp protease ATP-binding subunit ClpX